MLLALFLLLVSPFFPYPPPRAVILCYVVHLLARTALLRPAGKVHARFLAQIDRLTVWIRMADGRRVRREPPRTFSAPAMNRSHGLFRRELSLCAIRRGGQTRSTWHSAVIFSAMSDASSNICSPYSAALAVDKGTFPTERWFVRWSLLKGAPRKSHYSTHVQAVMSFADRLAWKAAAEYQCRNQPAMGRTGHAFRYLLLHRRLSQRGMLGGTNDKGPWPHSIAGRGSFLAGLSGNAPGTPEKMPSESQPCVENKSPSERVLGGSFVSPRDTFLVYNKVGEADGVPSAANPGFELCSTVH